MLGEAKTPERDPLPSGRIRWFPPLNGGKNGGVITGHHKTVDTQRKDEGKGSGKTVNRPTRLRIKSVARHADVTGHAPGTPPASSEHEAAAARGPLHHRRHRRPLLRTVPPRRPPATGGVEQRERLAGGDREGGPSGCSGTGGPASASASRASTGTGVASKWPALGQPQQEALGRRRQPELRSSSVVTSVLDTVIRADLGVSTRGTAPSPSAAHGPRGAPEPATSPRKALRHPTCRSLSVEGVRTVGGPVPSTMSWDEVVDASPINDSKQEI